MTFRLNLKKKCKCEVILLNKKKLIILVIACAFVLYIIIDIYPEGEEIVKTVNETWKIELPTNAQTIYYDDNITVDGFAYSELQYKNDSKLGKKIKLKEVDENSKSEVERIMTVLDVGKQRRPNFDKIKLFAIKEEFRQLYVMFSEQEKKLYIAESFI